MAHARRVKSVKAAHLSPARDHILALMREQLEAIRAHEPGTRAGADPEELHRMRTAVRRLRAILGATREMFDPRWLGGLRRELDWLGTVLGGLRDLDVFRQRLPRGARLPQAGPPRRGPRPPRSSGRRARPREGGDARRLREPALRQAPGSPGQGCRASPRGDGQALSPAIAAGQFRKLRKAVKALPESPSDDDLHAVRIKVKRARYAAELAQITVGRPAERFVARAKKLQDILGEHQDAVVAEERLRGLVARDAGRPERALAGKLATRQRARRQAAQMDFFDQWPKLKRRGDKAWRSV